MLHELLKERVLASLSHLQTATSHDIAEDLHGEEFTNGEQASICTALRRYAEEGEVVYVEVESTHRHFHGVIRLYSLKDETQPRPISNPSWIA